jgi:hypothetical protein
MIHGSAGSTATAGGNCRWERFETVTKLKA